MRRRKNERMLEDEMQGVGLLVGFALLVVIIIITAS